MCFSLRFNLFLGGLVLSVLFSDVIGLGLDYELPVEVNNAPTVPILVYNVCTSAYMEDDIMPFIRDADGDVIRLDTLPVLAAEYGDFKLFSDGHFVYVPVAGADVEDLVICSVCDDKGACTEFPIRFNVNARSLAISIRADSPVCSIDGFYDLHLDAAGIRIKSYSVAFDDEALAAGLNDIYDHTYPADNVIAIPVAGVRPNVYNATLYLNVHACGYKAFPFQLKLHYSQDIVVQKWNNVLAVLNAEHNGGYVFSHYQWMRNGSPIDGQTGPSLYLKEEDKLSDYQVLLTRQDDSISIATCAMHLEERLFENTEYPQLVRDKSACYRIVGVHGALLKVWNAQGRLLKQVKVNDQDQLDIPKRQGIYIIEVCGEQQRETFKIVIR